MGKLNLVDLTGSERQSKKNGATGKRQDHPGLIGWHCKDCHVPADYNYDESLSPLHYGDHAKTTKNRPVINERPPKMPCCESTRRR